jgi:hypothetical protein
VGTATVRVEPVTGLSVAGADALLAIDGPCGPIVLEPAWMI